MPQQSHTNASGSAQANNTRKGWERELFGGAYDDAKGFDRVKYGALNVMNDYRGPSVTGCSRFRGFSTLLCCTSATPVPRSFAVILRETTQQGAVPVWGAPKRCTWC